ncbi:hypothetical protein LJB62_06865 [Bacillus sp. DFI.2.34]|nr:hypothetical protein [Bacillus sp. DFI.2.34]
MTTKPNLVTILRRKTPFFGDETKSRRHFEVGNSIFWRRASISSPFRVGKSAILATKPNLVTILRRKTPFFGDETYSRRHFELEKALF